MTADAPGGEPVADVSASRPVSASRVSFRGRVWNVVTDTVDLGAGGVVERDYVLHPGAVAVMAYREPGEVALVYQYRHPSRRAVWEPPAGLLDVDGEPPLEAAKRELYEEADLEADTWHVLVDTLASPGGSAEAIRIFLARGIREVPARRRFQREAEELGMPTRWVTVEEALAAAHAGRLQAHTTLTGLFSLDSARRSGWASLRPADAPWERPPRGEPGEAS